MITIQPTTITNYTTFCASKVNNSEEQELSDPVPSEQKSSKALGLSLAGLAITGAAAVIMGRRSKLTYEEALRQSGVQIKDGIAVLIESGEKFTGSIKRNVRAFGMKRETVSFADGIMTEKVYHNRSGAELEGEFYKNGIKRVTVTKDLTSESAYLRYVYDSNGDITCRSDCCNYLKNKFDEARSFIKGL